MRQVNPISEFLASWEACHRHPSRKAHGFCDACQHNFCRTCIFPDHRCGPTLPATASSGTPRILLAGTLAAGALMAGAWTVTSLRPGEPGHGDRQSMEQTRPLEEPSRPNSETGERQVASRASAQSLPDLLSLPTPVATSVATPATPPVPAPLQQPVVLRPAPAPDPQPATTSRPRTARSFDRGPLEEPALLLTFDAGAHSTGAAEILDVLSAAGVRTTFFITGEFIRNYPELVERIVADGHEVGNHTETHLHLTQWEEKRRHLTHPEVDRERLLSELERTQAAYQALTGRSMAPLWRAPYGEYNKEILGWAANAGWTHVGWTPSMDTLDWVTDTDSRLYRNADEIARRLVDLPDRDDHGGHGAIVLMHLGSERPASERLGRILPQVLAEYRARGLKLLTASAMIEGS